MRIGIDIRSLSAKKHTGVDEYIYNLLPALFAMGKDDKFVLYYNSFRAPLPAIVKEWGQLPNVTVVSSRWPSKLLNLCLFGAHWPQLDKLLGNLDVIFFPNITFLSVSPTIPFVVTFHDLSFELLAHCFNPYRRLWHFLVNPREKAQHAAQVITVSRSTATDVQKLYQLPAEKTIPIYLGLSPYFSQTDPAVEKISSVTTLPLKFGAPPNSFRPAHLREEELRRNYQLPTGPFLLFLGTIEPRKNIIALIRAFNLYKKKTSSPQSLVIAGAPGWSYKEIYLEALKSPYRKQIYFPGPIKGNDRAALYQMASVFVFPSFFEGFGLPPLEAMASGTPVICSASTSLLEIFGDHALLVNPYDIGELAWAIERLLSDGNLRQSLITTGKKYAQRYSWAKTARATLAVLREAADKNE